MTIDIDAIDALYQKATVGYDFTRCDWCGWPLHESVEDGCVVGNCSMRPYPPDPPDARLFLRHWPALRDELRGLRADLRDYRDNAESLSDIIRSDAKVFADLVAECEALREGWVRKNQLLVDAKAMLDRQIERRGKVERENAALRARVAVLEKALGELEAESERLSWGGPGTDVAQKRYGDISGGFAMRIIRAALAEPGKEGAL